MTERQQNRIRDLARRSAALAAGPREPEDSGRLALRRRLMEGVLRGEEPFPVPRYVSVRRAEDGEEAPNGESFHVRIRASTNSVARDGGVVPLAAWEDGGLANFRKNPVVMLAHRRGDFPLGLSVHDELNAEERALISWWRFHEETDESRVARRLYEGGWMRAASVGFRIHQWHEPDEDEVEELREQLGTSEEILWVADRAELVEESAVGVPADPDALTSQALGQALTSARACGVDVEPFRTRLRALQRQCMEGDASACRALRERGGAQEPAGAGSRREPADVRRSVIAFEAAHEAGSYDVDEEDAEWDAADEVAEMEASEDALTARHAFLAEDADADSKTGYKFPHHRAGSGMAVVFRALANGFARLDQADISEDDKDGVAAHLGRHYRTDFDREPPEREAVAAAVRDWPRAGGAEKEKEADVTKRAEQYLEDHRETLEDLGGGDAVEGARAVLEALDPDAGERSGDEGEGAGGEDGFDLAALEDRVSALEDGVESLGERLDGLRESVEALREDDAGAAADDDEEGAGSGSADGSAEEESASGAAEEEEGSGEEGEDGRSAGEDPIMWEETDPETGQRLAVTEVDGQEVAVPLAEGETVESILEDVADAADRKLRGAPVPSGGKDGGASD